MTESATSDASAAQQRAMAFLMAESDGLARSRARVVGSGSPSAEALAELAESERRAAEPLEWLRILEALDDIKGLGSELAERVCIQLSAQQRDDGSWRSSEPSNETGEIFCTGMIAGFLAKTPFVRQRTLESAAGYLAARFDPDLVKGDAWGTTAAYFHCFSLVRHESADATLQWCGRELQRGLMTGIYDAVQTARVFVWCRAHALPGAPLKREELLERLIGEQCEDGSYCQCEGDPVPARVAHTLDALVGLVNLS